MRTENIAEKAAPDGTLGGREEPTWSPQLERKYVIRIQCRFPVAKEELLSISTFCQLFVKERSLRSTAVRPKPSAAAARRSRSVATAHMSDHDLVAPLLAERHVTTGSASVVAPIVRVKVAPIVIVAIGIMTLAVDLVSFTASQVRRTGPTAQA
jgi:hypothetical protein